MAERLLRFGVEDTAHIDSQISCGTGLMHFKPKQMWVNLLQTLQAHFCHVHQEENKEDREEKQP